MVSDAALRRPVAQRADGYLSRAPGGGRTHNLWLRRPTLYPIELQARRERQLAMDSADFHRQFLRNLVLMLMVRLSLLSTNSSCKIDIYE